MFGFGSSPQRSPPSKEAAGVPGPGSYHVPAMVAERATYIAGNENFKYI